MALKPWYKVALPREDLRKRQPLDAAQFAIHLDKVVTGTAPAEYVQADRFFSRTYITEGLIRFSSEVLRRLAGERQGSNAVLNLTTQFGGGKTHALTLLYHMGRVGPESREYVGVPELLEDAKVYEVPRAALAVFVGTDWDVIAGRGDDGGPRRKTPWGDIAWQLAQECDQPELFEAVKEQDAAQVRPGRQVIRRMLPKDRPVLILMDEVMNFVSAARAVRVGGSTLATQFYDFIQTLTEEVDSLDRAVVVVSLPKSEELEVTPEDVQDFRRLDKVTSRVAEPYVLAQDLEIPEIIRRRLFENPGAVDDIRETARAYARWITDHRDRLPKWFPLDRAQETFEATYPFHPIVLSVFERKWQALSSFQRTRGILRLLAQWVADAYEEGYKGGHHDPLITLGTAPLEEQSFRTAVLDQLGEDRLTAPILADIAGEQAHAERLDADSTEVLRKLRIHRKVATTIFFESSGGQVRQEATLPEIRLATGEPDLDIGHIEAAVEALEDVCYYLAWEGNSYRFSTKPNLNQLLADRRAALNASDVEEKARAAIQKVFRERKGVSEAIDVVAFPEESTAIHNEARLQLVVLSPDHTIGERTREFIERCTNTVGQSARRFKNGLVWSVPDSADRLLNAARQVLALESLEQEAAAREFDDSQRAQIREQKKRAERDLAETVWGTYRHLGFLGPEGMLQYEDLGMIHSSAADSIQALIQARLRQRDELTETLAPSRVVRNWPPKAEEWSTKSLKEAVYASHAFTRLLRPDALRDTITRGVKEGLFGYAVKKDDAYVHIDFEEELDPLSVEFSEGVVLVLPDLAHQLKDAAPTPKTPVPVPEPPTRELPRPGELPQPVILSGEMVKALRWAGDLPPQKWTTFYTKVLSALQSIGGLSLRVEFESRPERGLLIEKVEEAKRSLRELNLPDDVATEKDE